MHSTYENTSDRRANESQSTAGNNTKSEKELTLFQTKKNFNTQDSTPEDTHSTSESERTSEITADNKINSTPVRTADIQSDSTPERRADVQCSYSPERIANYISERTADIECDSTQERATDVPCDSPPDIPNSQEQNKSNTPPIHTHSSHSTECTHTENAIGEAISSLVISSSSQSAVPSNQITAGITNTDPLTGEAHSPHKAPQSADSYTPMGSRDSSKYSHVTADTEVTDQSNLRSQSAGEAYFPCNSESADSYAPRLVRYTQDSEDSICPRYEHRTPQISPRRDSKSRETTTESEKPKILREQYASSRAKSAYDNAVPKSRSSSLKSHSLNELLPARPADKDRESFSRFETALSRIDSLFRLLIKYLLSLDVSFPLLHSWTQYYQILSPERSPRHGGSDTNIMQDLERGWEGTGLFLELTRDCLSKIRSDSPRLRLRAGERLNKLLTFQILVLVARETVPSADMREVVRRFGTEEVCAELMSVPLVLSEGLSREQLMAVFLSHELFSLLTNCSRVEWSGRVRKKLDAITQLVTRSLPQRRPPLPGPSASSLLIAFYPLANSLIQQGFLRLEGLDMDTFIEFNSRTLLSSLPPPPPPPPPFSPYVTTGYLDQVFIFLNSALKHPRRHKTHLRILSFASSLFSQNCIKHISGGSPGPLSQLLHPSLSPIALLEFLTLLRECLLRLSRDSSSLLLVSSELLKELFLSVSALLSTHTMDRLLDWYTEWLFLDYYKELVGLCVTGLSDLQECCVERGLQQWVTQRLLTSDLLPSLLRVVQFLLVTQPDTDAFLPLLFLLSFCADTEDTLTHLVDQLNLPEWSEVPYSLFSHLLDEPQRDRELQLLLSLFLRIACLYKQRGDQLVPSVLRLVSDKHSSDLNRFYQLLAHENRDLALSVFKLVGMLVGQSQDSAVSEGIASQQDLISSCVIK